MQIDQTQDVKLLNDALAQGAKIIGPTFAKAWISVASAEELVLYATYVHKHTTTKRNMA